MLVLTSVIRQNENIHSIYKHPRWRDIVVTVFRWYSLFPGWYKRIILLMYVCLTLLQQFASMSGLNINVDKTKAVWIGSWSNSKPRFMPEINLDWNPVIFMVLGVVFSTDVLEIVTISFENKLNEMKKVLNAWSRRNLTSPCSLSMTYLLRNLPDPEEIFFFFWRNWISFNFLWNGKN